MRRLLFVLCLFFLATPLAAQVGSTTDVVRGRVTDERGEPVQGASIQVTSVETGTSRTTVTAADGRYTVVFPDGGGRYRVRVARLGQAPRTVEVARAADEDVLVANVQLGTAAVQLQGVTARAERPQPGRGEAGGTGRQVSSELAQRLPLENSTDASLLATLSPGVVATTGADSLSGRGGFSVAGQLASQNQVTLDGASFASALSGGQLGGGSPLGLPQEGIRGTQVVTNTYDVARGQFSGGQVASTTRAGTNRVQGSVQTQFRGSALQGGTGRTAFNDGYGQFRGSGGVGGPIVKDKLFYNLSAAVQRRSDDLFALQPRSADGLEQLGVSTATISEFLTGLTSVYGFPATGLAGGYNRTNDALSVLGRADWVITQEHTFTLRGYGTFASQDRTRIGPLETELSGGSSDSRGGAVLASVTSRFGGGWINEVRASYTADTRDGSPSLFVPQGLVRTGTAFGSTDGGTGRLVSTLVFGGDPSLSQESNERTAEFADELSVLLGDRHRVKLGVLANHAGFRQVNAPNRLGTFAFNSLQDFQDMRPASFTRTLSTGETSGGGWNAGAYLGDAFRPTEQLQFTFGARLEGSRFDDEPAANPAVASAFGVRTDYAPSEIHVSPRAGFSWRLNETGAPLKLLRGGFGEFRGRTPYELYAATLAGTGTGGELEVSCVGDNVPLPSWSAYADDPSLIPTTCADGTLGGTGVAQQPNVSLFRSGFQAPRSWRASLGFQAQLFPRININIDGTFARGVSQTGVRDLNLRATPAFTLANEGGRPVYAPAAAIVPTTGQTSLYASRNDPAFAHVYELSSGLASQTEQLSFGVNGLFPRLISAQFTYTLSHSRDQGSFGFGGPGLGFSFTPTQGDPNTTSWAPSNQDRRHNLSLVVGKTFFRALDISLIGRASSGSPYTPLVGADINADGARNDAAFVFPTSVGDTAVANGMTRLLAASGAAAECLNGQTGRVAKRNSCRGPWTRSLDMRATYTPQAAQLKRRLSFSIDAFNLPAGLDLFLHGGDDLHGWGQFQRPDNVLLYPVGFDPVAQAYRYRVNEGFGQSRVSRTVQGSSFGVQLSARLTFGAQNNGGGLLGIAFGGGGPGGGGGGPGGGGGFRGERGGPGEGPGGGRPDASGFVDRLVPQPVDAILLLGDSLKLSDDQVARIRVVNDSLKARNAPIREEMSREITAAFTAQQSGAGQADPQAVFRRVGPRLNEGRQNVQKALDEVQRILTPEQWRKVPAALRNSVRQSFGPPR
jgi:Carboxypeptidase regulatory-like domain/LTXXQ motif family protein